MTLALQYPYQVQYNMGRPIQRAPGDNSPYAYSIAL